MNPWMHYTIHPGSNRALAQPFYAPNLDTALTYARVHWPYAKSWTCISVTPR